MISEKDLDALVIRCNNGDKDAWEEFYVRFQPLVRYAVSKCLKSRSQDVDDVAQEVFIRLFSALRTFESGRSLEAYVLEIARRVAISDFRKTSAAKRGGGSQEISMSNYEENPGSYAEHRDSDNQEKMLIRSEEESRLRNALRQLKENCRLLLSMRYELGLAYKEIAAKLGTNERALRVRVHRCLSTLGAIYSSRSWTEAPANE
jgi:RNA polymerase sigma-70 factor, ECF subfamily